MRKSNPQGKTVIVIGVVFSVMGFLVGSLQEESVLQESHYLLRREKGAGDYEAELKVKIEGMEEEILLVSVPEQSLTAEEELNYLEAAVAEIETEFVAECGSAKEVRGTVPLRTGYQSGRVDAEWSFSNPRLVTEQGIIVESVLKVEREHVKAEVLLTCEDSSLSHEFYFTVCRRERSEEEILYGKINDIISKNGKTEGTEKLLLPTTVEGRTVSWEVKEENLTLQILLLGGIVLLFLPALNRQKQREQEAAREEQLLREYPEMVNKLALLLGAGMTLQGAWKQVVSRYQQARNKKQIPQSEVYEEMLLTFREIENGKGEGKAYQAFGERCGVQRYRKFSNYLVQNLKKGSGNICEFLSGEATEMFEERKSMAQRYGEELGTKLLLPMMLMLAVVIFIIMVPAILTFGTGV